MTKREYAEEIARALDAEVQEVEKANGVVLTGVIRKDGGAVNPCVYIDDFYEKNATLAEAVNEVKEQIENNHPQFNTDFIKDFEQVKPKLMARLYNKATNVPISRSADKYGFDDLIITPVVNFTENGSATTKVNQSLLDMWGTTADEVIDIALENAKANAEIRTMEEILMKMMGGDPSMITPGAPTMMVITNKSRICGAISVLFAKERLEEIFPNGYIVIPSSIHEVIATEIEDTDAIANMIGEVNDTQVGLVDQLGTKPYTFAA